MDDLQELIDRILANVKVRGTAETEGQLYHDRPILRTAAQMAGLPPKEYREMRRLLGQYHSEQELFYRQGLLMAEVEDNCPWHGVYERYFPTYQSMSDLQLRGYFTWRTRVRRGEITLTNLSFVFVYIYELLNNIGVSDPADGFQRLHGFWALYRQLDGRIDRYMRLWLHDYVIYYDLDVSLLRDLTDTAFDEALLVLQQAETRPDEELLEALSALSTYRLDNSRFYKKEPEAVRAVVCGVFRKMAQHCEKHCRNTLCERLFGSVITGPYNMFSAAVFYDQRQYEDYTYAVDGLCRYTCTDGSWSCQRFLGRRERSTELGSMLKTVDSRLRERLSFPAPIKPGESTRLLLSIIDREIDDWLEAQKKAAVPPPPQLDLSALERIRTDAAHTRDRLLTEDELAENTPEEENVSAPEPSGRPRETAAAAPDEMLPAPSAEAFDTRAAAYLSAASDAPAMSDAPAPCGLTPAEMSFLRQLLTGQDALAPLRSRGLLPAVVADAVNEKLFDLLGDTAVVFEDDVPTLIEDYIDELKGLIGL